MSAAPALSACLGDPARVLEVFLAGYWSQRTRANYAFILDGWFAWCAGHDHDPLRGADPRVVERWISHGGAWWAAAMLLGLNGLRCGELVACDVTDVGSHSWHHTLAVRVTKGDKPTVVALAPPTMQAVHAAVNGRTRGPVAAQRRRATHGRLQRPIPCRGVGRRRRDHQAPDAS